MRHGNWCGMTNDEIQNGIWDNTAIAQRYIEMPEVMERDPCVGRQA
jgi:hypothetical protein